MKSSASVRQDGDHVLLVLDGKSWRIPWRAALELSSAIRSAGKLAEEDANVNRIIADNAILMRAGVNLDLTNNRKILAEAKKEAEWGDLRRHMPASFRNQPIFGLPTVKTSAA